MIDDTKRVPPIRGPADSIDTTDEILLFNGSGIDSYPGDKQGLLSAVSDATKRCRLILPARVIQMGTDTLTLPDNCKLDGAGKRTTYLTFDEGVDTAIVGGSDLDISGMSVFGPNNATNSDTGIDCDTFTRAYNVECGGFVRNFHLDGAFNSVIGPAVLASNQDGDASAVSLAGGITCDVAAGSHNNTRILGCYIANCSSAPAINIEANEISVGYCGFESNEGDVVIECGFGSGLRLGMLRFQKPETASKVIRTASGSSGIMSGLDGVAGPNSPSKFVSLTGGDWNVCDPIRTDGFATVVEGASAQNANKYLK